MKAKRILFITSEMTPFVPDTDYALKCRKMPQAIQEIGHEIRTFCPDWGIINERRNQLHEVIRLSGMNLIIDDTDHPLIIKVASLQAARMQVYFIDNEEYFSRKGKVSDANGNEYTDNGERIVFYSRGTLETVKKLRWVPDVIHCFGWAAALAPLFIKEAYKDEPSFCDAKVVFSATEPEFTTNLGPTFHASIPFKDITDNHINDVCLGECGFEELQKIAIKFSDGVILDSDKVPQAVVDYAKASGKPVLAPQDPENYVQAYCEFYDSVCD